MNFIFLIEIMYKIMYNNPVNYSIKNKEKA